MEYSNFTFGYTHTHTQHMCSKYIKILGDNTEYMKKLWLTPLLSLLFIENNAYSFGRTTIVNLDTEWVLKLLFYDVYG